MASSSAFTFGVIADIQYADCSDANNFAQNRLRRYRNTLKILNRAVSWWNSQELTFISHLGDIIDGCNKRLNQSTKAMQTVLSEFDKATCKQQLFAIGNHELYNFEKSDLHHFFRTKSNYFHFSPSPGFRVIQLDSYHVNNIVNDQSPEFHLANRILAKENPDCLRGGDWFANVKGAAERFVPYNGALGEVQLAWFDQQLAQAQKANEKVIVLAHVPFYAPAATVRTVTWDCEEAMAVLGKYSCVVACLHGHEHDGGYAADANGVHHIVLPSVLEAIDEQTDSFGVAAVFPDRIEITGRGLVPTKTYPFSARTLGLPTVVNDSAACASPSASESASP